MQWYIMESIAHDIHLGIGTNLAPLADAKFILVENLICLTVKLHRMDY